MVMSRPTPDDRELFADLFPEDASRPRTRPFSYSLVGHSVFTALLLIVPRVWVDEPDEKLITLSTNRYSKLVWYRLDTTLPKLAVGSTRRKTAPEVNKVDPNRPLQARVPNAPKTDQVIAQPDAKQTVNQDVATPDMAAFRQPPKAFQPPNSPPLFPTQNDVFQEAAPDLATAQQQIPGARVFVPPPAPPPGPNALLLTAPVLEAARAAALPVYRDRFVAPPQAPGARQQLAMSAPQVETANANLPEYRNRFVAPPSAPGQPQQQLALNLPSVETAQANLPVVRDRFVAPPARPTQQQQLALNAPTVETARTAIPGPAPTAVNTQVSGPAKPQPKPFVAPPSAGAPVQAPKQQLALNAPAVETARAAIPGPAPTAVNTQVSGPAKPQPKQFVAPPSSGAPATAGKQNLNLSDPLPGQGAKAAEVAPPPASLTSRLMGELSALAASIRPATSGAVPQVSRPGSVSSGPEGKKGETRISGEPAKNGIEINTMPNPSGGLVRMILVPRNTVLPRDDVEKRRGAVSLPMRLNAIPEVVQRTLGNRTIYLVTVSAPNLTHYSGDLQLWFAERRKAALLSQDMHPPIAFRFTDPVSTQSTIGSPMSGIVRLSGMVDENGFVRSIRKIDGMEDPRVNDAVLTAVSKWTFMPATRGMERMDIDVVMEIPLSLKAQ